MAAETGTPSDRLTFFAALAAEPSRFGFFSALRRIEALHPDRPRLGAAARASDDPVRLGQEPSMIFAPATLAAFGGGHPEHPRLEVLFLGLFGPNGPLPIHLTEFARERLRNASDPTFARFADLFHHRMLSLFYRAWALNQPTVDYDRPQHSRTSAYLGSLFGVGRAPYLGRDAIPDAAKYHYAGHLANQSRHAEGLSAMVTDFLRVDAEILEFIGEWIAIPEAGICRLGASPETSTLGMNVIIGSRVWASQQKFRVRLGPLSLADYERLLPGGESLQRLVALVRNYLNDEFDWDANLVLRKEEIPEPRLGGHVRLGWTSWLCGAPETRDRDDLELNPRVFG
ncbi:MAG: type VI secretion system baseplate subunit TssG [Gammaproteobacteria bacterium]|nr:type VI secretion system baseplate subunit TssG [Gammaproteobacteria bacterium]MBI5615184.1 type VI secretion system baseplate subunit TssG [Gammaproteobacteria bacterium]